MNLLFELSLQRGTLSHLLDAILLLLHLSNMPVASGTDKNKRLSKSQEEGSGKEEFLSSPGREGEGGEVGFPLVPFLRRLSTIPTPQSPYPSLKGMQEVTIGHFCSSRVEFARL